jgi:hypothetical protein
MTETLLTGIAQGLGLAIGLAVGVFGAALVVVMLREGKGGGKDE